MMLSRVEVWGKTRTSLEAEGEVGHGEKDHPERDI